MIKAHYILALFLLNFTSYGQTTSIQTQEIKLQEKFGYTIFNICANNPEMTFDDKKEYLWYTEFSKIQTTKGGAGGNLLHGNYKFYAKDGKLKQERNYYFGLLNGSEKYFDSFGKITWQQNYNKGECVYSKFLNDNMFWIEWIGPALFKGSIKKVYTQKNSLISEEEYWTDVYRRVKTYYEHSGKLKSEYNLLGLGNIYVGKYTSYFENGNIEIDGNYYDGHIFNKHLNSYYKDIPAIKVDTWKYFNSNGTINSTEQFKMELKWKENKKIEAIGGYIFDNDNNTWVKIGKWIWERDTWELDYGVLQFKKYEWGVEIKE